jgi:hypothetical protein
MRYYHPFERSGYSFAERLGASDPISAAIGQIALHFAALEAHLTATLIGLLEGDEQWNPLLAAGLSFEDKLQLLEERVRLLAPTRAFNSGRRSSTPPARRPCSSTSGAGGGTDREGATGRPTTAREGIRARVRPVSTRRGPAGSWTPVTSSMCPIFSAWSPATSRRSSYRPDRSPPQVGWVWRGWGESVNGSSSGLASALRRPSGPCITTVRTMPPPRGACPQGRRMRMRRGDGHRAHCLAILLVTAPPLDAQTCMG